MARPPILDPVDWPGTFARARSFEQWLAAAELPDHRESILSRRDTLELPAPVVAALSGLGRRVHVLVFAEDWCPDVVRHVPVLERMAAEGPVEARYLERADAPGLFARFLTNGGESLPKFVFFSEGFAETGSWGPMPAEGVELIARGKAMGDVKPARRRLRELYAADPDCRVVVSELLYRLQVAAANSLDGSAAQAID